MSELDVADLRITPLVRLGVVSSLGAHTNTAISVSHLPFKRRIFPLVITPTG